MSAAGKELAEELIVFQTERLDEDYQPFQRDDKHVSGDQDERTCDGAARKVLHHVSKHKNRHGEPRMVQREGGETHEGSRVAHEGEHVVQR